MGMARDQIRAASRESMRRRRAKLKALGLKPKRPRPRPGPREDKSDRSYAALAKLPALSDIDGRPAADDHPITRELEAKLDFRRENLRMKP